MAQDTLLGFPAHTLPFRCGESTSLSTPSTEAGRLCVRPRLLYIQLLLEHFSASMASTSISARRASAGFTTSMT